MNYSFKTISKKVMGDLHTPVSIYLKVRDIYPESACWKARTSTETRIAFPL